MHDLAQGVAGAGLKQHLGTRRRVRIPLEGDQVAAAPQPDQVRLELHLWQKPLAKKLYLAHPDSAPVGKAHMFYFKHQAKKAPLYRIEVIAIDGEGPRDAPLYLLAPHGSDPLETSVHLPRTVRKFQSMVPRGVLRETHPVAMDPEERAQVNEQLVL